MEGRVRHRQPKGTATDGPLLNTTAPTLDPTAAQQAPKRGGVERIAIQNEVLHAAEEAVAGVEQVPCELCHPHHVRLTGDPGDLHSARLELHDEEDAVPDQAAKGQHLDGERVGCRETVPVRGEKRFPRRVRAALGCRRDAMVLENGLDRVPGYLMAEALQPPADARVAPGRILARHADHKRSDAWVGRRATGASRL
jgi:hypothetical protein